MMKKWTMFVFVGLLAALSSCNSYDDIYLSASCRPATLKEGTDNSYTFKYDGNKVVSTTYNDLKTGKVLAVVRYTYNDKNQISKFSTYKDSSSVASEFTEVTYNESGQVSKETTFERSGTTDTYVQSEYVVYNYNNKGYVIRESLFEGTSTSFKTQKDYTYDVRDNKYEMRLTLPLQESYLAERYTYDDNKGIDSALPLPLKGDKNNLLLVVYFDKTGKVTSRTAFQYVYSGSDTRYPISYRNATTKKTYEISYICR